MKTRYGPLVTVNKSIMEKSERVLLGANADLSNAKIALELSYNSLEDVEVPAVGKMSDMLASRTLLNSQRNLIQHNKEWVDFAKNQVDTAQKQLKLDMIKYEKFNYLNLEEIKKQMKKIKAQDAKDLDEIALMMHARKEG